MAQDDRLDGRGGSRPGSGRRKGSRNRAPAQGRRDERRQLALPPEVWAQVDQLAAERGWTRTRLLKEAVLAYLRYCSALKPF